MYAHEGCRHYAPASAWRALWLSCVATLLLLKSARSFEVFSEQQILQHKNESERDSIFYNNSELGSTEIDDYWAKIDVNYSPLEGWSLIKYLRVGCFNIRFATARTDSWSQLDLSDEEDETTCVGYCNGAMAYYAHPRCRCAYNETDLKATDSECTTASWEVFREFDFRSSTQPTAYDVARRFLYQLVSVKMEHVDNPMRHYIHAINVFENKPVWNYDTLLDRTVFNSVWDFQKSKLVALSWYPEDYGELYFTSVFFNTSGGTLEKTQTHTRIQDDISASGNLLAQFTSVEGMGTVDILYGTYYSVVPAQLPESPYVVHVIIAIDISTNKVIASATLPVTLMNLQINALTHVLYGAGVDLYGNLMYYQLCTSSNATKTVGSVTKTEVTVECEAVSLGELPSQVSQLYLQSASIDHHYNYAWFAYKEEATGRPLILEYHQDDSEYIRWREESLPLEAGFTSLIQTAPRIIFVLYPPTIDYAKFNSAGTKIFVQFDASTLQGAVPQDSDGDEIPDYWNEEDRMVRVACEEILDDYTMTFVPGAMCQWVSDSRFFIEISMAMTIMPGDLVRLRANAIYAGKISASGVAQFSQPSTDFAAVQGPDEILTPTADIAGTQLIDSCTDLTLDGTGSTNFGYRGAFVWKLNGTDPDISTELFSQVQDVLLQEKLSDPYQNPHTVTIEKYILLENTSYIFLLNVTSLWDEKLYSVTTHSVYVSSLPVPTLTISGPTSRTQNPNKDMVLTAYMEPSGCAAELPGFTAPITTYKWRGCLASEAVDLYAGIMGCSAWHPSLLEDDRVTGINSKTMRVEALAMEINTEYMYTVIGVLTASDGSGVTQTNYQSTIVTTTIGSLEVFTYGGNGFSTLVTKPFAIDLIAIEQGCIGKYAAQGAESEAICQEDNVTFEYSCTVDATGEPCPLDGATTTTTGAPSPTTTTGPDFGFSPSPGGGVIGGRLLADASSEALPDIDCSPVYDSAGQIVTFSFRGETYNAADGVTTGNVDAGTTYCMPSPSVMLIRDNIFDLGFITFTVNMTKVFEGTIRIRQMTIRVELIEEQTGTDGRFPMVAIALLTDYPVVPSHVTRLTGTVTNAEPNTTYLYTWSAYQYTANPDYDQDEASIDANYSVARYTYVEMTPPILDFTSEDMFRTPVGSRFLVMNPSVLSPSMTYRFRLDVVDPVLKAAGFAEYTGFAEFTFSTAGLQPSGGILVVDGVYSVTGTAFVTVFQFELTGWGSEDIPLTYSFGYTRDPSDEYETVTYLTTTFTERSYFNSFVPMGRVAPDHLVTGRGYVKSSMGAVTTSNTVNVYAPPPTDSAVLASVLETVQNLDVETALLFANMIVQSQEPSNPVSELVSLAMAAVEHRVLNTSNIARTAGILYDAAHLMTEALERGLRTQDVADHVEWLVNRSMEWSWLDMDFSLIDGEIRILHQLIAAMDAALPGVVTEETSSGARRLTSIDSVENRTSDEQFSQLLQMQSLMGSLGTVTLNQLVPGEVSFNFSVRGEDVFLGKDYTVKDADLSTQGVIKTTFELPTMKKLSSDYGHDVFSFRYQLFKKFPYAFWDIPERQSLDPPADDNGTKALSIPTQGYRTSDRLWHAVTLDFADDSGVSILDEVTATLEGATFDRLLRLDASSEKALAHTETIDFAATCYTVGLDGSLPHFDSRGITLDQDSCVSTSLKSFVIIIDDLPQEIYSFESLGQVSGLNLLTDRPSTAAVGTLLICCLVGLFAGGIGIYVDEKEHDKTAIDISKSRVVDLPDAWDKLLATLLYTFQRNHLVIGLTIKHRKLSREKRVWCIVITCLATQALATVLHANWLSAYRASQFTATGLTTAVLVYPLTIFLQFLYEWRPMTRIHSVAPPRSIPPASLEHDKKKAEVAQAKSLHQPKRPTLPAKARPPPRTAAPRVPLMSQLALPVLQPGLPLDLPKLKTGSGKIAPPPRAPGQRPRPPSVPPPEQPILASTAPSSWNQSQTLQSIPGFTISSTPGQPGPFGLTLPELPPLQQGSVGEVKGQAKPAPPAKKAGGGPRPPAVPPPVSKMFFAVPERGRNVLRDTAAAGPPPPKGPSAPATPSFTPKPPSQAPPPKGGFTASPPKMGGPKAITIPPLPTSLSAVRLQRGPALPGDPVRPPPPPNLPGGTYAPAAPDTPREGEEVARLAVPGMPEPPPEDVESLHYQNAHLARDPEHSAGPPNSGRQSAPSSSSTSPARSPAPSPPLPPPSGPSAYRFAASSSSTSPLRATGASGWSSSTTALPSGALQARFGGPLAGSPQTPAIMATPSTSTWMSPPLDGSPSPMRSPLSAPSPLTPAMDSPNSTALAIHTDLPGTVHSPGGVPLSPSESLPAMSARANMLGAQPTSLVPASPSRQGQPVPPAAPPPPDALVVRSTSPHQGSRHALALRKEEKARMDMVLAPLRPQHASHAKIPMPKHKPISIPNAVLAKIPAVPKDMSGLPPPPPPPVGGFGDLALLPLAPEEGQPMVLRKMVPYKPPTSPSGSSPSKMPRPPPKLSANALRPTAPRGPPPSHAIVLAKDGGAPGFSPQAIVKAAKAPSFAPPPPKLPPPSGVRRDELALAHKQMLDELAKGRQPLAVPGPGGSNPFETARRDPVGYTLLAKRAHDAKAPKPVPDYIVQGSLMAIQIFMLVTALVLIAVITFWGTYLPSEAVYPTYIATIIGIVVNLGLFESVKCIVICCLALVQEESERREFELQARLLRMELKAQRIFRRGKRPIARG